jgi:hypothetical protein
MREEAQLDLFIQYPGWEEWRDGLDWVDSNSESV